MKVKYDKSVDAAYIDLDNDKAKFGFTYKCDPSQLKNAQINLDFDENFVLIGIEVLDASKHLSNSLLDE